MTWHAVLLPPLFPSLREIRKTANREKTHLDAIDQDNSNKQAILYCTDARLFLFMHTLPLPLARRCPTPRAAEDIVPIGWTASHTPGSSAIVFTNTQPITSSSSSQVSFTLLHSFLSSMFQDGRCGDIVKSLANSAHLYDVIFSFLSFKFYSHVLHLHNSTRTFPNTITSIQSP
jgi:hypothetical protein